MTVFKNLTGGQWIAGTEAVPNINPSNTADGIGDSARSDAAAVDRAVDASRSALPDWDGAGPQLRRDVLEAADAPSEPRRRQGAGRRHW